MRRSSTETRRPGVRSSWRSSTSWPRTATRRWRRLLSLPSLRGRRFTYTAVAGDADADAFRATAERYRQYGFTDFKLKLSGNLERDREHIEVFRGWNTQGLRIRVDANNLWNSAGEAAGFLRALDYPFFAVEEPLRPNQYDELARIADMLDCRIVLDESLLRASESRSPCCATRRPAGSSTSGFRRWAGCSDRWRLSARHARLASA